MKLASSIAAMAMLATVTASAHAQDGEVVYGRPVRVAQQIISPPVTEAPALPPAAVPGGGCNPCASPCSPCHACASPCDPCGGVVAYSPGVCGEFCGRNLFGRCRRYVAGQPVRNVLRWLTP